MSNIWPLQKDCPTFYGVPDANGDGLPDRQWEDSCLRWVTPPWQMTLAWDTTKTVSRIRVHNRCADSLGRVLGVIWAHFGCSNEAIQQARLHLYGGAYNFRMSRTGHFLSMHSYGCAIDLDPEHNAMGTKGTMNPVVIDAFKGENWTWGGGWMNPDPMHFQAARVA